MCRSCWLSIHPPAAPRCRICGEVHEAAATEDICVRCLRRRPRYTLAVSAGPYEGVLRQLVHELKYRGCRAIAPALGQLMRERGAAALAGADMAVAVPLPFIRFVTRGFNQADDLARELGLPVVRALSRRPFATPQSALHGSARRRNVQNAFRLKAWPTDGWARPRLTGATVVLVDDVMTTGATLDACAAVLLDAGVSDVRALTLARASAAASQRLQP